MSSLSPGASQLLSLMRWFIRKTGECFTKQKFLAKRLRVCVRTVKTWLSELVGLRLVKVQARGPRGSLYDPAPVEMAVEILRIRVDDCPDSCPDPRQLSLFTELTTESNTALLSSSDVEKSNTHLVEQSAPEYVSKKPPTSALRPRFTMPHRTVTNEFGRVDINPAWARVQNVLRDASGRIARARNPRAYERAILERECPDLLQRAV